MTSDILYHYCSNHSFLSIVKAREVALSELTLSNDVMEGKWVRQVFSEVCAGDDVLSKHQEKLLANMDFFCSLPRALGFCLSEEGDLLSQWRGYADNGSGISIGFNKDYLDKLWLLNKGGGLRQVIYDKKAQRSGLDAAVEEMKKQIGLGAFKDQVGGLLLQPSKEDVAQYVKASSDLWMSFLAILPLVYTFKNPAFREEREWRLMHYPMNDNGQFATDALASLEFRAAQDRVIPVKNVSLDEARIPIISRVILGPKNITPESLISSVLAKFGFTGVDVMRSDATYR